MLSADECIPDGRPTRFAAVLGRPFAANPGIQRIRAFTAWRKGVASLRWRGHQLLQTRTLRSRLRRPCITLLFFPGNCRTIAVVIG